MFRQLNIVCLNANLGIWWEPGLGFRTESPGLGSSTVLCEAAATVEERGFGIGLIQRELEPIILCLPKNRDRNPLQNLVFKNAGSRTWTLVHSQMCRLPMIPCAQMCPHTFREARWTFYSLLFRLQYCSAPPSPHPMHMHPQCYFMCCHFMHQHIMKLLSVNLSNFESSYQVFSTRIL